MAARDLSVIKTPPPNRQPVETKIVGFDEEIIRDAISYELQRDGQVYFINNRIENLRVTTNQGNSRNCKLSVLSTTGYCGVAKLNHGKFKAHIKVDGKQLHLGNFDTPEQAHKVRIEAEIKYNFHENHGLSK